MKIITKHKKEKAIIDVSHIINRETYLDCYKESGEVVQLLLSEIDWIEG